MNYTTVQRNHRRYANSPTALALLGFLILLIWSSAALAQISGQNDNRTAPVSIRVTHLLGFEEAPRDANGTLSIQESSLQFEGSNRPAVRVEITSIQDVFLGEQSKQVGGAPMTLGKAAVPFGGGRIISLFAHKKYDTLALQYVDANGGVHGAIFQLNKGEGRVLKNELVAKGAHVSHQTDEPEKQGTREVANESK
jgi:hypothetical protein